MAAMVQALARLAQPGWHMDFDQGGWFWMALMMIVGAVVIIVVVYFLIRALHQEGVVRAQPPAAPPAETPLEIAKRRLASGEINEEEFERIKNRLEV